MIDDTPIHLLLLSISGRHGHTLVSLVSFSSSNALSLAILSLLILLNQITASAAAGSSKINKTAALEVMLLTKTGALKGERDPV